MCTDTPEFGSEFLVMESFFSMLLYFRADTEVRFVTPFYDDTNNSNINNNSLPLEHILKPGLKQTKSVTKDLKE